MRFFCDEIDVLFIYLQPVVEGFIFGIGRPMETFGVIDLDLAPVEVCTVTMTTEQER